MNTADKLTNEQYEKNFTELKSGYSRNEAVTEANRCLYCFDSPCMKACPTHIDISTFIKKISTDNVTGSAKTIYASNWVPLTCAKACPVDDLCEGACVMHDKGEKPIEIGRLQRYAIEYFLNSNSVSPLPKNKSNGKSVGIIGSGPAGLACGAELVLLGYEVIIYEAKDIPGGLDTWGIAPYKMRQADSMKEVKYIEKLGVKIKTGTKVGSDISIDKLNKLHDAIFIGAGLTKSGRLNIPGEDLNGVVDALTFIEKIKEEKWNEVDVGRIVAVVGAGNTAIDAATEAKRLGAEEVIIIYRRSRGEMPANDFEYELAKSDGIRFQFLTNPVEIAGNNFVEEIKCVKMKLGDPDGKGRRKPVQIPGTEFSQHVDMVITSLGQQPGDDLMNIFPDLQIENGKVVVSPETFMTGVPNVFAGGDCINGGREVVNAAYDGKMAAQSIDKYLNGKS